MDQLKFLHTNFKLNEISEQELWWHFGSAKYLDLNNEPELNYIFIKEANG